MKHLLISTSILFLSGISVVADDIVINMTAANSTQQILEGAETETMRYTAELIEGPESTLTVVPNTYLGPIISVNTGDKVQFISKMNWTMKRVHIGMVWISQTMQMATQKMRLALANPTNMNILFAIEQQRIGITHTPT